MDRNFFTAIGLSMLVFLVWNLNQPVRDPNAPPATPGGYEAPSGSVPPSGGAPTVPDPTGPPPAEPQPAPAGMPTPSRSVVDDTGPETRLQFDGPGYRAELTTLGGALAHWELEDYHSGGAEPEPIVLTTGEAPFELAGTTPFSELGLGDLSRVNWELESSSERSAQFRLTRNGVTMRKRWSFDEDFTLRLRLEVSNDSDGDVAPAFGVNWPAHVQDGNDFREQALATLYDGSLEQQLLAGLGTAGFLGIFGREPQRVFDFNQAGNDWAGVNTTYFLSALLPDNPKEARVRFYSLEARTSGITQLFFAPVAIPPGLDAIREYRGYLGPKRPEILERVGGETSRSIDLGWSLFAPLARIFGSLLHVIYEVIPNYGLAIILLTIGVRVVTTPLTMKQMRSMERMRELQPRLKEIQEKYADDRQKQSEAMMSLYRSEKVNPLGGCLPMLLQLPVFIGLFYALRGSIQLRQAPFFGWIQDLSAPETLFTLPILDVPVRVLPLVMGATMVIQQRITPMQMDPAQARMMMTVMPIVMTFVFYQFASGLVLYWMVSNVLAISHQLWVGRRMRAGKTT